jgi:hypothetical protein
MVAPWLAIENLSPRTVSQNRQRRRAVSTFLPWERNKHQGESENSRSYTIIAWRYWPKHHYSGFGGDKVLPNVTVGDAKSIHMGLYISSSISIRFILFIFLFLYKCSHYLLSVLLNVYLMFTLFVICSSQNISIDFFGISSLITTLIKTKKVN